MSEDNIDHARAIGEKLRTVRQQKDMSLRDLGSKVDISASMLSQIETGKAYPSVRSIYNIAAALGVPVDYFFPDQARTGMPTSEADLASGIGTAKGEDTSGSGAREQPVPVAENGESDSPIVHADARPTIELSGGVTWARLTSQAEPDVEFLEISYAPGASSDPDLAYHTGREFGLILEGELSVALGTEEKVIGPGDSIIFDSTTPHRLSNETDQPVRALWVVWGQD